jgi:hypothetical protein
MLHLRFFIMILLVLTILALGTVVLASIDQFAMDTTAMLSPGRTYFTVTGTVTCSPGTIVEYAYVRAFQGNGSNQTQGGGDMWGFACTGSPQSWQINVGAEFGQQWHPGKVTATAVVATCVGEIGPDWYSCDSSDDRMMIDGRLQIRN